MHLHMKIMIREVRPELQVHMMLKPKVLKLENHMVLLRLMLTPKEDMMMQTHRVTMYR